MKNLLKTSPLKGMLDEHSEAMETYNWIKKKIETILLSHGYEEYDTPILEPIDIYLKKSSEELIKTQSYTLEDKKGRSLVLRPELTPSLARMVSGFYKEKKKPFRLYSFSKCFRYERPQRGRLREFKQLNIDLIAEDPLQSGVESFYLIHKIMNTFNVKENQFEIRYSFRNAVNIYLKALGVIELSPILNLIDRKNKLSKEIFQEELKKHLSPLQQDGVLSYLSSTDPITFFTPYLKKNHYEILKYILDFQKILTDMNLTSISKYSPETIRGIDYYNGLVFETYGLHQNIHRSLLGGGQYPNLLESYTKDHLPGLGFAIGIPILTLFLQSLSQVNKDLATQKSCGIYYLDGYLSLAYSCASYLQKELNYKVLVRKHKGSLKKIFSKTPDTDYLTIIGEDEAKNLSFKVKHWESRNEKTYLL